ncbi:predicted protein [Naegleria gruberi]|uniref:Predicted protein n=1 Tax=Naegleria gruberi TaxID=5762 RepID=D2VB05_NAEGR|nr:uncharacterized protein NAEGRDRAFT_66043 [Naegleria gruberi]EFC46037.1 predicted protein [Naegleria gruberi]|eukprot:XP_002678781.1 predicted protein [Naegleria gruberi strain NEG-M]
MGLSFDTFPIVDDDNTLFEFPPPFNIVFELLLIITLDSESIIAILSVLFELFIADCVQFLFTSNSPCKYLNKLFTRLTLGFEIFLGGVLGDRLPLLFIKLDDKSLEFIEFDDEELFNDGGATWKGFDFFRLGELSPCRSVSDDRLFPSDDNNKDGTEELEFDSNADSDDEDIDGDENIISEED